MAASASTSFVEQEEDEFDKVFMFHNHFINAFYDSVLCLPCKNPKDIKFSIKFQSLEINYGSEADEIQPLEIKCGSEVDESRAWGFFYVGSVKERKYFSLLRKDVGIPHNIDQFIEWNEPHKEDAMEIIHLFEQSLAQGKSSMLRYLASWKLGRFYDVRNKPLQGIRYYRIQLQEAESLTEWKHAKECALYNLCKSLSVCGEVEEARIIEKELKMIFSEGLQDPFTLGLYFHCHGHIAWVMSNFKECIEANNLAIQTLSIVSLTLSCTSKISGIMIEPLARAATMQIEWAKRGQSIFGNVNFGEEAEGAKMLSLIAILKEEDDEFYQSIVCHQYAIARNDVELVWAADNIFLAGWVKRNPTPTPIMDERKSEIVEGITGYLTGKCRIEAEESRAWAFYYVGQVLKYWTKQISESSDMYEQSLLHGKSSILKYMASMNLANFYNVVNKKTIRYRKIQLEAAEATTWKGSNSKVYALYQLSIDLCRNSQSEEATRFQEQLSEVESDDPFLLQVVEGLSYHCEAEIAAAMADYEKSRQACHEVIAKLEDIEFEEIRDDILHATHTPIMSLGQRITEGAIADANVKLVLSKARSEFRDFRGHEEWKLKNCIFMEDTKENLEKMRNKIKPLVNRGLPREEFFNFFLAQGQLYLKKKNFDEAKAIASELLDISQRSSDGGLHAFALMFAAEVAVGCCPENVDEVERLCIEAQKLVPKDPTDLNFQQVAFMEANLYFRMRKWKEATTQAVSGFLSTSFWIHMACHATFKDVPDGSLKLSRNVALKTFKDTTLVLASNESYSDYRNKESGAAKGFLTAEDIANGGEIRAVAIVLSACSSGRGRVCAEGTLGLTRSFHLAGVPTVVASTWDVNDNATSEFMKRFYTNIRDGCQVATALRTTMVSMIEKYEPLYWAPFFISGSPSLKLPGRHTKV